MAYAYEVATGYNFPNITIYNRLNDGVLVGYRANANEGYVFYNRFQNSVELDPETGLEVPVTYYYTVAALPLNCNFDNFPYVAVLRSTVDENYIFGGNNNDHEIM